MYKISKKLREAFKKEPEYNEKVKGAKAGTLFRGVTLNKSRKE